MTVKIPEGYRDLIDGPVFVTMTTIMPDGQPQTTPVWCNADDQYVYLNTARERQKAKNIEREARVTICAIDPKNPYRYIEIRGRVIEVTEEGAVDHINQLAHLYQGVSQYYGGWAPAERAETETRLKITLKPTRINAH